MASKMSYMFAGAHKVPMVVRAIIGRSWGQGAQHSQAFHSYFMHVPGLRVVAPTTPHDAKGCLIQAIRDDNPVIMIEHRMLHNVKGVVPEESYEIPYGKARVLSAGKDITIVGISHMALECVRAKHLLEDAGIDAEVIDPVSLSPLDISTIAASVERTGRLLVVDTGSRTCTILRPSRSRRRPTGWCGARAPRRGSRLRSTAARSSNSVVPSEIIPVARGG
jgi:pyruvate dehydrogenase E1 component beta subunit